jgi:hypothetical protein
MLIQTQLSNYDTSGNFILECDSGWQMVMGRVRVMLEAVPDLEVVVMCPRPSQCLTLPEEVNADLIAKHGDRLQFLYHRILPNALATRYDFDFQVLGDALAERGNFDVVYVNDPMLLRNLQALFHLRLKHRPKFVVHSHFIDNPGCPKFPTDASLWMGQCEAARKADVNFWQCDSAMEIFFKEMAHEYTLTTVYDVRAKSWPWDDGYSSEEINVPVDMTKLRFDPNVVETQLQTKALVFVPNRIGGKGRSSDYTNCGHFMFDVLPQLRQLRKDFVVVAGNPSQKITNQELVDWCGPNGFINLVPGSLNRDEFKWVAKRADVAVGLYNQDSYGGTATRECIDLGCMPTWLDCYEYGRIARLAGFDQFLAKSDLSNVAEKMSELLDFRHIAPTATLIGKVGKLREVVRMRCSYEETTQRALKKMGIDVPKGDK